MCKLFHKPQTLAYLLPVLTAAIVRAEVEAAAAQKAGGRGQWGTLQARPAICCLIGSTGARALAAACLKRPAFHVLGWHQRDAKPTSRFIQPSFA